MPQAEASELNYFLSVEGGVGGRLGNGERLDNFRNLMNSCFDEFYEFNELNEFNEFDDFH